MPVELSKSMLCYVHKEEETLLNLVNIHWTEARREF
jgi:hypothetical protein